MMVMSLTQPVQCGTKKSKVTIQCYCGTNNSEWVKTIFIVVLATVRWPIRRVCCNTNESQVVNTMWC